MAPYRPILDTGFNDELKDKVGDNDDVKVDAVVGMVVAGVVLMALGFRTVGLVPSATFLDGVKF